MSRQEARPIRDDGRQGEQREASTRAHDQRPAIQTGYRSKLYVDPANIPPDKKYGWIAISVLGNDNADHAQLKIQQGWQPVPPSRHPEMVGLHIEGFGKPKTNLIERGGLVLCEMDKALWEAIQEQKHLESMAALDTTRQYVAGGDAATPRIDESSDVGFERVRAQSFKS